MDNATTLPTPDEILRNIRLCEEELRSWRRLLRAVSSMAKAREARARRASRPATPEEARHA